MPTATGSLAHAAGVSAARSVMGSTAHAASQGSGGTGTATVPTPVVSVPTTAIEIKVIRAQRSEISSQISNITDRRNELADQLRSSVPGADRAGLESRIAIIDKRINELENDLSVTGRALASARGDAAITVDPPSGRDPNHPSPRQITAMSIVFFVAVLMPLSIAWGRALYRRSNRGSTVQSAAPEVTQRLERMEVGIEAIAIEVERISEGQRFVTKLLGEGAAKPLRVGEGVHEPVAERRG